jgi:uncharacterized protein YceH (UPF0502 family)
MTYDFGSMNVILNEVEARILGALMEKETTTPEYYPMSLNALVNACNQKSNREPVMSLDEDTVRTALYNLRNKGLAATASGTDSRVAKYEHRMHEVFNFTRGENAIICVLLLRGPQTPGELRGRTERLFKFEELSDVQGVLQRLAGRDPALVKVLPRQPGTKEARYAHLLSGDVVAFEGPTESLSSSHSGGGDDRISRLEEEMERLRTQVGELAQEVEKFRRQFE